MDVTLGQWVTAARTIVETLKRLRPELDRDGRRRILTRIFNVAECPEHMRQDILDLVQV